MTESPPNQAGGVHWARFLVSWVLGFLLYWWFIAQVQPQQLVAGALVGALAALAFEAVCSRAGLDFAPKPAWVGKLLWRLPPRILEDLGLVTVELFRALFRSGGGTGTYKEIPFRPGGNDSPSAARRALVAFGVSVPPNTFVVSTTRGHKSMVVHELVFRRENPGDEEWPV